MRDPGRHGGDGRDRQRRQSGVDSARLDRLTLIYACCYVTFNILAAFFYTRFPFGRHEHELRMARLTGAPVIDAAPREPFA